MDEDQRGFYYAWESLLMDFEEVLVGSGDIEGRAPGGKPLVPVFDRPFSIVKFFQHPAAEMGLELRADGTRAVLSMFRQEPSSAGAEPESTELGNVSVRYRDLLETPDDVLTRFVELLPVS